MIGLDVPIPLKGLALTYRQGKLGGFTMGMKFKKVNIEQVKLKKAGEFIEGYLRQTNEVQMQKGPATEIVLQDKDGNFKSAILGVSAAKAIKTRTEGEYVRITLKGEEKTLAGNRVNLYDVEVGVEG